ncbi:hypothetical protein CRM22_008041 [Opisthorchis felineus]|uniref:Uncharacterized protein n=1 Tax=Opisthorchis felineus TaxID=147828 RepID=A0A4S2LK45_OPIFE|nr:hypothetical protein CRM22_008041 [Opisthorchis felineus]
MNNDPDNPNRSNTPRSPVHLYLYTNDHGWTTIDPDIPLSQQPIAASWFTTSNTQNPADQGGYRAVFVESNLTNSTQPQQRGLYFTAAQPQTNTSEQRQPSPLESFPPPPPFPEFPAFPPNPWEGAFSRINRPPPFPLYSYGPPPPPTSVSRINVTAFPFPLTHPMPNPPTMPPWPNEFTGNTTTHSHPHAGTQHANNEQPPRTEENTTKPPDYHNQSNMHFCPRISPCAYLNPDCLTCYQAIKVGQHAFSPEFHSKQCGCTSSIGLCSGDRQTACGNYIDKNSQNSNLPPPPHLQDEKEVEKMTQLPKVRYHFRRCASVEPDVYKGPHYPQPYIRVDSSKQVAHPFMTPGSSNTPRKTHRSQSADPVRCGTSSTDNIKPASPREQANGGLSRSVCSQLKDKNAGMEPNHPVTYWSFQRRVPCYNLPPPPCQCCPCLDQQARSMFCNDLSHYAIFMVTSGHMSAPPLKYSASNEVLSDQVTRFCSTDLNATHTMEAIDESGHPHKEIMPTSNVIPSVTAVMSSKDSSETDSILTAFTKAAWNKLGKEMDRLDKL